MAAEETKVEIKLPVPENRDFKDVPKVDETKVEEPKVEEPENKVEEPIKSEDKNIETKIEEQSEIKDDVVILEIDGSTYTQDANGNALNEDGTIAFSAEDIQKMSTIDDENDENTIESIAKLSGIVITDETGKEIIHDFTVEGLAERESKIKELGEKDGFNKGFNSFLSENPDIASIIDYKNRYGTIEGYNTHVDYVKMEVPTDENELYNLVYTAEIQKGSSRERAKRIADFAKADGHLAEDATESLKFLQGKQKEEEATIAAKNDAEIRKANEALVAKFGVDYTTEKPTIYNVEGSVYDMIVAKGRIGDLQLPKEGIRVKTKEGMRQISNIELFDYLSAPVVEMGNNLYTRAEKDILDLLNNPVEYAKLAIQIATGGVDQLVQIAKDKETVAAIRKLTTKNPKASVRTTKQKDSNSTKTVVLKTPLK